MMNQLVSHPIHKMIDQLKNHILTFVAIPENELDIFLNAFEIQTISNKEYLVTEGSHCKHKYFILQGCFRCFFVNRKGVEKVVNFGIENWWITDFDSFINQTVSHLNIQATEDSVVLKISKSVLDTFLEKSLPLNQYFRIILEKVRVADQKRIQFMYDLSGEELYDVFCDYNPDFVQRIPQYMLASYLGFTPEFLSKIRGQKKS
ncbi:Crp/Fnr family transcriptional regulator [Aquimarina sp. 2201CG5-10]|uniref:Crp/Fnr family transcriptional regulator n=1 Tax=Aquimarina callyspongiae TaxID=3098150 RepID=UPI002AB49A2A|nr:Crp/Fnr family transcriptional regulator [Aquimarina sp. 2201CG5-10]MDY8134476.1 Crp/Fnr family transcriptional regulator [Aquimarina sp. 2201CG5-10]